MREYLSTYGKNIFSIFLISQDKLYFQAL